MAERSKEDLFEGYGRRDVLLQFAMLLCLVSAVGYKAEPHRELVLVDEPEEFNASNGSCGRYEVLEAEHLPSSGLDAAMVLLDERVQILRRRSFVSLGSIPVFCISRTARCEAA
jgi:hypothetical protein